VGEVVQLSEAGACRGRGRRRHVRRRAELYFDLACPFSYLAAERVERSLVDVDWRPASASAMRRASPLDEVAWLERVRSAAEYRARELHVPLVWPDRYPGDVPEAMRAAAHAAELGRGAPFVLAAGRLAFCGGFDLTDPDVLAEAAAAADVPLDECFIAAADRSRDAAVRGATNRLLAVGADRLPALRISRTLVWGERRVAAAAAAGQLMAGLRR
jgi:2-hydroxychromene-2-carboxylate isomerase